MIFGFSRCWGRCPEATVRVSQAPAGRFGHGAGSFAPATVQAADEDVI